MRQSYVRNDYMRVYGENRSYIGGSQYFYEDKFRQKAGCGPTNAAFFLMCLSESDEAYKRLVPDGIHDKTVFTAFMNEIWEYATPGLMGLNNIGKMASGVTKYANEKGVDLNLRKLPVSINTVRRPDLRSLAAFLKEPLSNGLPVLFLNLSNGNEKNLDGWHWISIIEFDPLTGAASCADQGEVIQINLMNWIETSKLGGGFVCI